MSLGQLLQSLADQSAPSWQSETYDLALARDLNAADRAVYVEKLIDRAKQGDTFAIMTLGHLKATEAIPALAAEAKSGWWDRGNGRR